MGYIPYYLALIALQQLSGVSLPWVCVAIAAVFLVRRWLPNPYLFVKHARRVRRLRAEIADNPDNATARRDLAKVWLEKRRPRRAIPLLEEALRRDGESLELRFLLGRALLAAGRPEGALEPLVEVAMRDARFAYGEPYLVAGCALSKLRRDREAEDALERYLEVNSSSVQGRVRLARVRRELGDKPGARAALDEARRTYRDLPRFRRRPEWKWHLLGQMTAIGLA
jgi:predicted Zn-dependent protease